MQRFSQLTDQEQRVFRAALETMAAFHKTFERPLDASFIAELYVAQMLKLQISKEVNQPGYDAISKDGQRYQIKYRAAGTQNIDLNNFDFDNLVLVNLDKTYSLIGMWQLSAQQARKIFVAREEFRKHQTTQKKFKEHAEKIFSAHKGEFSYGNQ